MKAKFEATSKTKELMQVQLHYSLLSVLIAINVLGSFTNPSRIK